MQKLIIALLAVSLVSFSAVEAQYWGWGGYPAYYATGYGYGYYPGYYGSYYGYWGRKKREVAAEEANVHNNAEEEALPRFRRHVV